MSLVEYSNQNQNLVTVSMHYYEKEEYRKDKSYKGTPVVQVDPLSRCAALLFYNSYFALLPFVSDTIIHNEEESRSKIPYLPSFVIQDNEIDPSVKNILDFKFLYGFLEPALAILFETEQTVGGYFCTHLVAWRPKKILFHSLLCLWSFIKKPFLFFTG
jgi:cleavage and polyadenylation specificity factor subunit 1